MRISRDIEAKAAALYNRLGRGSDTDMDAIAEALQSERERCAKTIEDNHTIIAGEPADPVLPELVFAIREGL